MRKLNKGQPYQPFIDFVTNNNCTDWKDLYLKGGNQVTKDAQMHLLLEEQECYCGYTELLLDADGDAHIDHYKQRRTHPELCFNWDNYIVATNDEEFGAKYKDNTTFKGLNKANSDSLFNEILNPVTDKAEDYFEYTEFGSIVPKKDLDLLQQEKAKKTIEVFNLDNTALNNRRKGININVKNCINGGLEIENIRVSFKNAGFPSALNFYTK